MKPTFFATPADFRAWLEAHHESENELLVGFYKRGSGKASITWPESVDEALCFGWIDGVRRRIDEVAYSIRFTPRRPRSNWSAVNIRKVEELIADERMRPPGLSAFEARLESKSKVYSYEQRITELDPAYLEQLKGNAAAWEFFQGQPPWYRKTSSWWVMSAKREDTRQRRLAQLIEDSAAGRRIRQLIGEKR